MSVYLIVNQDVWTVYILVTETGIAEPTYLLAEGSRKGTIYRGLVCRTAVLRTDADATSVSNWLDKHWWLYKSLTKNNSKPIRY